MIIHIGPNSRKQFRINIERSLKSLTNWFLIGSILMPMIVYGVFKINFLDNNISKPDMNASVALLVDMNSGKSGSAFLVSDKILLTAKHVMEGVAPNETVKIVFSKATPKIETEAKLLFLADKEGQDFAVLELISPIKTLVPLELSSSNTSEINDEVIIIGYPNGNFSSAKAQIIDNDPDDLPDGLKMFGGAWPGNSGGPIINTKTGEVIGILVGGFEDKFKNMLVGQKIDIVNDDKRFKP